MKLFDQIERDDNGGADFSEGNFHYLNRSGRSDFRVIRQLLEQWFSRYPKQEQAELRARFRSRANVHHVSAFFELFLHELLLCLDYSIVIHPNIEGSDRSPDFLVTTSHSTCFYLEATIVTFKSDEDAAAEARLNQVYDVLNRKVDSKNFYISVEVETSPRTQPPGKRIAQFLNRKLSNLDPDEVAGKYETGNNDDIPTWRFDHEGWSITFSPIPKKPSRRGRPGAKPLGMFSSGFRFVDHRTPIRDSVQDKVSAYGSLGKPYIVAVNAMESIDEIDVMEALFGKEQFDIILSQESPLDVVDTRMKRKPDGVWTSVSGPKNKRLSATFVVENLRLWSLEKAGGCLYHNPWALYPCVSILSDLPHSVLEGERMKFIEGKSFVEILGIDCPEESAS